MYVILRYGKSNIISVNEYIYISAKSENLCKMAL
jgi:hypothetical protein